MTRRPRVLHLTTSAVSLDWLLAPQLHAFGDAGFEVLTASSDGPHVRSLKAQGIEHHLVASFSRNIDPLADVRSVRELRRLLETLQPDILHTHNPKPGVIGRVLGRASRVPVVVNTVHGLYAQRDDSILRRLAVYGTERLAAACSDAELVQNVEDVATLRSLGVPSERVHLLGNGIDLGRFCPSRKRSLDAARLRAGLGISPTTLVIGMVGRLVWEKGYDEFFRAIKQLRARRGDTFKAVIVGPFEVTKEGAVDRATIERMKAHGVHFLGVREDVETVLASFDVVALPSHREGFPRAAMEASAMGVPVVASDIRGCRQVIDDGRSGLLVPAQDAHALALALGRLLDDPAMRRDLGIGAMRRAATEFDQKRVISRTLAVYRSALGGKSIPAAQSKRVRYIDSIDLVAADASKRAADALAA